MGRFLSGLLVLCLLMLSVACGGGGSSAIPGGNTPPPPGQSLEHVVVVLMQNASFDHLFATFPGANGIQTTVPGYSQTTSTGTAVSPYKLTDLAPPALKEGRTIYLSSMNGGLMDKFAFNNGMLAMGYYDGTTPGVSTLWTYAQQYALADNYFSSVTGEAPTNQLYMVAADDNNFPYSVQPVYGPCQLADSQASALTFPNVGDQLTAANRTWGVYQESFGNCTSSSPLHNAFQYFTSTNKATKDFSVFGTDLAAGNLPAVSFIIPNQAHNMHPGYTPMTDSVTWLDNLIKQIQASSAWSSTAILVTWDTGGGWYDHVYGQQLDNQGLGQRVPLLVISPLAKKGYISHTQMDHVSILRFIQNKFALPSLNTRNGMSNDLSDMFQ